LELDAKHRFLQELTIDAPLLPKDEVVELGAAQARRFSAPGSHTLTPSALLFAA